MCLAVWPTRGAPPRSAGPKSGGEAAAAGPGCSLAWTGRRWFLARERFGLVWLGNGKFWLSSPPPVISLRLAGEEGGGIRRHAHPGQPRLQPLKAVRERETWRSRYSRIVCPPWAVPAIASPVYVSFTCRCRRVKSHCPWMYRVGLSASYPLLSHALSLLFTPLGRFGLKSGKPRARTWFEYVSARLIAGSKEAICHGSVSRPHAGREAGTPLLLENKTSPASKPRPAGIAEMGPEQGGGVVLLMIRSG